MLTGPQENEEIIASGTRQSHEVRLWPAMS
jgi:hypothetical protein